MPSLRLRWLEKAKIKTKTTTKTKNQKTMQVTVKGIPIIILENKQAFSYDFQMKTWLRVADNSYELSEFRRINSSGILSKLQGNLQSGSTMAAPKGSKSSAKEVLTESISHLESLLASAVALKSSAEYMLFFKIYLKRLSEENQVDKLREVFTSLLGPAHLPTLTSQIAPPDWEPMLLDMPKREVLRQGAQLAREVNQSLEPLANEFERSLEGILRRQG